MLVFRTRAEVQAYREKLLCTQSSLALVPTMGALHEGHIALLHAAREQSDCVVATIFVNPKQFDQADDFQQYPRCEKDDFAVLRQQQVAAVFAPTVTEMYPADEDTTDCIPQSLSEASLCRDLCGQYRPGHFAGVLTIVAKLLDLVRPHYLVLGDKDYQQSILIGQLLRQQYPQVQRLLVASKREPSGLACSSRNQRLTLQQRTQTAPQLYRVLQHLATEVAGGNWSRARAAVIAQLEQAGFRIEYIELRSCEDLRPLPVHATMGRILAAVWLGDVRLIDNVKVA